MPESRGPNVAHFALVIFALVLLLSVGAALSVGGASPTPASANTPAILSLDAGPQQPGEPVAPDGNDHVSTSVRSDVEAVHADGVTGEGVRIGVVGTSFDQGADAIDGAVLTARDVDSQRTTFGRPANARHDTAVAEVAHATAPGAKLVLVELGPNPTLQEYRDAMEWLVSQDVDVVVDAGSYFPRSQETADGFAEVTDRTSKEGVVVVTSAGNLGNRHWSGVAKEPGWVSFGEDGSEANPLGDGRIAGDVSLRLHAEGSGSATLYLYRRHPSRTDSVVAKANASDGVAAIDTSVPEGTYYVAARVEGDNAESSLSIYAPSHDLGYRDAAGSIPVTTGDQAVTVSAIGDDGAVRADSSRGDLTLAAPGRAETSLGEIQGTSAAAPYVAGSVALLQASTDVDAEEGRRILLDTADKDGDVARIDLEAALERAREVEDRESASTDSR